MSDMPYPGLRPFKREESDIFFGREKQSDLLLEKLAQTRFISVVGLSGCGKSSLVRAGMLAALETGYLSSAGSRWQVAAMRPGDHPLHNLISSLHEEAVLDPERLRPPKDEVTPGEERLLQVISEHGPLGLVEIFRKSPLPAGTNLLLLVDQFEEIFRYHRQGNRNEAELFVAVLLTSAEQREVPIYVVTTMRSDFIGDCALFRGLPEMMNHSQFLVPRLTREQQRMAIVGPARVFGDDLEPRLVNRLLDEMGTDPDQLPLLQHCLMRMWFQVKEHTTRHEQKNVSDSEISLRKGMLLTMTDYDAAGGFKGALSKHADEAYNELTPQQQKIAAHLFRCLSEHGPAHRDTRRLAKIQEVAAVAGVAVEQVIKVVDAFREASRSFITPSFHVPLNADSVLDISHESLIRQWRRMARWVEEEAESANIYQRLGQTASLWKQGQAALWRTPDLEIALAWQEQEAPTADWAQRYGGDFNLAITFLETSAKAQVEERLKKAREQEKQRLREERDHQKEQELIRMRRRLSFVGIVLVLLGLGLSIMGFLWKKASDAEAEANKQRRIAEEQADIAQVAQAEAERQARQLNSNQLALQAQRALELTPQRSLLLAVEAVGVTFRRGEASVPFAENILRQSLKNTGIYGLSGHEGAVWSVSFSPDNRWLVSGSADGALRLWDLHDEDPSSNPIVLSGHERAIWDIAISEDNRWLVSGSEEGAVRLWDLQHLSNAPQKLSGHKGQLSAIEISPDNRWLITGDTEKTLLWELPKEIPGTVSKSITLQNHRLTRWADTNISPDGHSLITCQQDGTLYVWDLATDAPGWFRFPLHGHQNEIRTLAFSRDSRWLATGGRDGSARLWNLTATGMEKRDFLLEGHTDEVRMLSFSPDGRWLITSSRSETPRLWTMNQADPSVDPALLEGHDGPVYSIAVSPDSHWLVTGGQDGDARLWDLQSNVPTTRSIVLKGHQGSVFRTDITPDSHWLITRSLEGSVLRWDLQASDPSVHPFALPGPKEFSFRNAISSNSRWMASGSQRGVAWLWDLSIENPVLTPVTLSEEKDEIVLLAFNASDMQLVSGDRKGVVMGWDIDQKKPAAKAGVLPEELSPLAISADGLRLAGGRDDHTIAVFDLQAGGAFAAPLLLHGHKGKIRAMALSLDGRWLATGSEDLTARLWDLQADDPAAAPLMLQGHEKAITAITISPDGRWLATGSKDMSARLWDLHSHKMLKTSRVFQGHEDAITVIALSPDQRWLITGSRDQSIRLWPLQSEKAEETPLILHGHEGTITHITITSDNQRLITGSSDSSIRIWNLQSQNPAAPSVILEGHKGPITAMSLSADNRRLATGSEDRTLKLWTLQIGELIHLACQAAGRNLRHDEWRHYFQGEPYRKTCPDFPGHEIDVTTFTDSMPAEQ